MQSRTRTDCGTSIVQDRHYKYFQKRNGSAGLGRTSFFHLEQNKSWDENRNSVWKLETGVGLHSVHSRTSWNCQPEHLGKFVTVVFLTFTFASTTELPTDRRINLFFPVLFGIRVEAFNCLRCFWLVSPSWYRGSHVLHKQEVYCPLHQSKCRKWGKCQNDDGMSGMYGIDETAENKSWYWW